MMKKSYLFLFALLAFSQFSQAQVNISIPAPQYDGSFGPYGPNSNSTVGKARGCYLVPQSELTRLILTNSVITSVGFDIYRPGGVSAAGQLTLYLANTTDVSYTKGTSFSGIIPTMTLSYAGNMTLPTGSQNATTTVGVNLTTPFTWNGGGIYVAFDWAASAAATTTVVTRYLSQSNPTGVDMGAYATETFANPAPATLTLSSLFPQGVNISPQMRFTATNIATNEAGVVAINAPGVVSKLVGSHPITAIVRNNSANVLNSVPVTLNIAGTNPYNTTQNATNIPAGGTVAVQFTAYTPTNNGISNMTVSVAPDQFANNDLAAWQQSVNCTDYSNSPPIPAGSYSTGGYGYAGQAILATPMTPPSSASMTAIKFVAATTTGASSICGVLLDAFGSILATTNTVNAVGGLNTLSFTPAVDVTGGTLYYFGIAQLTGGTFPFATAGLLATINVNLYYNVPIAGGSIGLPQNQMGYVGMTAALSFSNTTIKEALTSKDVICKQDGPGSVTLTVDGGATTYTWNWTGGNAQGASVVVSPTVAGTTGTGSVKYTVTGTDGPTGCKTNAASITVSVAACTALSSNTSGGYNIKVFPNPSTSGKSTISGLVGTNALTVYNTLGQVVLKQTVTEDSATIDLSGVPSGNYLVKITSDNNESRTIKLVTQN